MDPSHDEATDHPLRSSLPGACPSKIQSSLLLFHRRSVLQKPSAISSKYKCGLRRKAYYGNLRVQRGRALQGNLNCPASANQSASRLDFAVILTMELFL